MVLPCFMLFFAGQSRPNTEVETDSHQAVGA